MPETTLRETLSQQYDKAEAAAVEKETVAPIDRIDEATLAESERVGAANNKAAIEATQDKPGRTANRLRDESGRLLPGKKESAAQDGKASAVDSPATAPVVAETPKPKINRPSSWKKDHWESFDKLAAENPALAEYINQREGDYAKGVSTYKQQWDTAKPVLDAMQPFMPVIQQTGMEPAQWINELGQAHRVLAMGTPAQKLEMFKQIALNNGIDLKAFGEQLFVRGQDGQLYFNQQLTQRPAQQPAQQPQDVRKVVQEMMAEQATAQAISAFEAEASEKYPHYETVKQTMIGLLQAGLANDLPGAYQAAIRLPAHSEIFDAIQEQERKADAERKAEEARKAAQRARQNAVSTKTATPTGADPNAGAKGRRAALEAAYEQFSGGGRV